MTGIWLERGAHLGWERGVLRIERDGQLIRRLPPRMAGQVMIHGAVSLDSRALTALAEAGVPVTLMPARASTPLAQVTGTGTQGVALRDLQHRIRLTPALAGRMARQILAAKWAACARAARHLSLRWEPPRLPTDVTPDALMGHEGAAARNWYQYWGQTLGPAWAFDGRKRRPPPDPVNALLSLTYTLAGSLIPPALCACGLDPAFGFLHQPRSGRAALALDVLEPLRPWCDVFVQRLTHSDLHPERHFSEAGAQGVRLNREGQIIFYETWGAWRHDADTILQAGAPPALLWPDTPVPEAHDTLNDWMTHLVNCVRRHLRHLAADLELPPDVALVDEDDDPTLPGD